jgi:hypothetical protein
VLARVTATVAAVLTVAALLVLRSMHDQTPFDHTLLVLDRMTAAWSVVPGTPIRPLDGRPLGMAWGGGDVLVVATGEGAVALWHPGDSTVYAALAPQNSAS